MLKKNVIKGNPLFPKTPKTLFQHIVSEIKIDQTKSLLKFNENGKGVNTSIWRQYIPFFGTLFQLHVSESPSVCTIFVVPGKITHFHVVTVLQAK